MRIISNRRLVEFAEIHPEAAVSLQVWRRTIEAREIGNHHGLRSTFNSVDRVGDYYIFNIGGNRYRLIAAIHFRAGKLYVRHVMTHREYDRWKP